MNKSREIAKNNNQTKGESTKELAKVLTTRKPRKKTKIKLRKAQYRETHAQRINKIANAKALKATGLSNRAIGKLLDVSYGSVGKWLKLNDEQANQLSEVIKRELFATDYITNKKAVKAINEHLENPNKMSKTKLWELSGLYKTTREFLTPKANSQDNNSVNIQLNINKDNFSIDKL